MDSANKSFYAFDSVADQYRDLSFNYDQYLEDLVKYKIAGKDDDDDDDNEKDGEDRLATDDEEFI